MGSTQKTIGAILLGIGTLVFIGALATPDLPATAIVIEERYDDSDMLLCDDGDVVSGEIDDGWEDCWDGSDEGEVTGSEMGAFSCCCLVVPGFFTLVTNYNAKNKQIMMMQNPVQMQMQAQQQMQMQAQRQQMQMQAQRQQMQMQAQRQQMQMRQSVGSAVQQVGAKISGNNQNRDKFKEILSMVLADGYMSKKEEDKIEKKRIELNISVEEHKAILKE